MYCENCGNKLSDSAKFCSNCGAKVIDDAFENENNLQKLKSPKKRKSIKLAVIIIASVLIVVAILLVVYLLSDDDDYIINNRNYLFTTQTSSQSEYVDNTENQYIDSTQSVSENEDIDYTQNITESTEEYTTVNQEPQYYTSKTNSNLSALPGTATVTINGDKYTVDDNGMKLNYAECVTGIYLKDIDDKYTIDVMLLGVYDRMCTGFEHSDFKSYTTYMTLEDFYDSSETDAFGDSDRWVKYLSTKSYYSYFKTTDMVVEEFDTSGITAIYFNIVTESPSTGKKYDIEILAVSDFSNTEIGTRPNVCSVCAGSGSCVTCSGTGTKKYYNAVTKSMSTKNCTVCHGTGKCSICGGTGNP